MSAEISAKPGRTGLPKAWRYTLVFLGLILLVAGFYGEEHWRGRRAWEKYQASLVARGEPVEKSQLIPPPVSDVENFAMTPFLAPLYDFLPGTQKWRDTNGFSRAQNFAADFNKAVSAMKHPKVAHTNSWVLPVTDFSEWNLAFHDKPGTQTVSNGQRNAGDDAKAVLVALAPYGPILEEIQEASRRPYSRFNMKYDEGNPTIVLLPHLAVLKQLTQILQLRASVELATGQTGQAFQEVELMLHLVNATRNEPILVSLLVRLSETQLALQVIEQGLRDNRWSDQQLSVLQQRLQSLDFCADARRALQGERVVFGDGLIDYFRASKNQVNTIQGLTGGNGQPDGGFEPSSILLALVPSGWFYFEKLNFERVLVDETAPILGTGRHISPGAVQRHDRNLQAIVGKGGLRAVFQHKVFLSLLVPATSKVARRTAYSQEAVDLAVVACALERYKMKEGRYPEKLDAVSPHYLSKVPSDIITGQPLNYRLTEGNTYKLYSVGWNEKDDGGVVSMSQTGWTVNEGEGDWVWR